MDIRKYESRWMQQCHNSRCSRVADRTREHVQKNAGDSLPHAESDLLALRDAHIEVVKYKCIVIYGCNSRAPHGTQYANIWKPRGGKFCLYTSAAITTSVINIFSPRSTVVFLCGAKSNLRPLALHLHTYAIFKCIRNYYATLLLFLCAPGGIKRVVKQKHTERAGGQHRHTARQIKEKLYIACSV